MRSFVIGWLQALIAAFQFLTRLPIPVSFPYTDNHFRRSVIFYPLVGFIIGAMLFLFARLLTPLLPASIVGLLLVALWTMITGALHLDGLMDSADGLLSHRSRERMLEIMKDSRVGAMGVIVCVFYLLLKIMLVVSLLEVERGKWFMLVCLILIPVWSRSFMVTSITGWPYARMGQGLGALYRSVGIKHAVIAAVGTGMISISVLTLLGGWSLVDAGMVTLTMAVITYGVGFVMAAVISRRLGGLTGDVYGALNECVELILLLALVLYAQQYLG